MKKIVLIVVVLIAGITSQAQVKFGAKAGANLASWGGDDAEGLKSKFGFHAGALVNIPVSTMFSVQPELLYSTEGAKVEDVDDATINLNFLNIPVLLQYNNPSGFYAETGPQIGLLMSAKTKVGDEEEDIKEFLKGSNFSWNIGVGFRTKSGLGFGARYSLGLSNLSEDGEGDTKQNNFGFGLSYLFGGSKGESKK